MDLAKEQIKDRRVRKAREAMDAVARKRTTISYRDLLDEIAWNVAPNGPQLTALLCEISAASLKREGVLLSAVVVNADGDRKGIPGSGFFDFSADRGFEIGDERAFWNVEVEKVYSAATGD